ncbi:MAG TPA: universal stress protein [Thermodesulfovibrionales bacterium]|nr:universal stress protein [Thermodesulfovibrionales bacterium]
MNIKKIMVPTDGSDYGKIAIEYGIYIAKRFDAQLTGIHVMDIRLIQGPVFTDISGSVGMTPYQEFLPMLQDSLEERAETILQAFRTRCEEAGVPAETKKTVGVIDETIVEEGINFDLILLAQRGEHFHLGGALLGSTAESVVRKSRRPVMVTPATFREIESMGLAYDGSGPADNALQLVVELYEQTSWPLTVIIITDDHGVGARLDQKIEDFLEPYKIDSTTIILRGREEREIIKFIKEGAVELMVMGAYGHNRLRELILGSTTSHIIRESTIPVLLSR